MKKVLIFLLLLLNSHFIFSQVIPQGRVEYLVSIQKKLREEIQNRDSSKGSEGLQYLLNNAEKIRASLIFKGEEAVYTVDDKLNNDNEIAVNIIGIFAGENKLFYQNNRTRSNITKTSTLGETFLVLDSVPDWRITKETKFIGDYLCYKAVIVDPEKSSSEKNEVVAWFAPKITGGFGPLKFHGLPGLILELNNSMLRFRAEKIELNLSDLTIDKPTEGKRVTKKEYYEIGQKAVPDFFHKK